MKKYKNKITAGVIITLILTFAYWYGGDAPMLHGWTPESKSAVSTSHINEPTKEEIEEARKAVNDIPVKVENATEENKPQKTDGTPMTPAEKIAMAEIIAEHTQAEDPVTINPESALIENTPSPPTASDEKNTLPETKNDDINHSEENGMTINDITEKDKYRTDPPPEGQPVPVEPQNAVISDKEYTCTLSIRCDTVLENISWLDKEKLEIIPENGIIYEEQTVTFYEGESVFNLLLRETKRNKIHMEFENTPIYNSAYIEGIGNLYEFDCGELSGWMYKVNGWFPNYGCSRYQLKPGDKVEWVYTCDLGIDVGGYYSSAGNQP